MTNTLVYKLVLQSPAPQVDQIAAVAALAGAPARALSIEPDLPAAWVCDNVTLTPDQRQQIDTLCQQQGIDANVLPSNMQLSDFKLVAMDMDSTLITIECIDEIADMQGLKPQVAAITEAAMRGELDFCASLTQRVALLKGLDASALQRVYDERLQLSNGAANMLKHIQAAGLKTLLVSGGFSFFTERLQQRLGLDFIHANTLEIIDGKLTGRVLGKIVDATEKRHTVERICAQSGFLPQQAIVMGDGANDLQMMSIAGLSLAYRAKPVVRQQARAALHFCGLDGVMNLLRA
ncbi:MAG: phosphoserine phosphatase SerB [Pseudomonadota bacterium]|jgi:phosphoserine phosphatase